MAADKEYDESRLASQQWDRYVRARDGGHTSYVDMAKKCDLYYTGDQWADEDITALKESGRPWLTINEILPTINTILGEHSRTRADVQFKPRGRGAIGDVAQALNMVYMQIAANNNLDIREQDLFADGVITGRGYYDVRMDFTDAMMGEVRITVEDPQDIVLDPDAKSYDPKEWKEVFKTRWMTVEDIEEAYGKEHANKVQFMGESFDGYGIDSIIYQDSFSNRNEGVPTYNWTGMDPEGEKTIRKIRVIERQHRKLRKVRMFVDNTTGDMREVPDSIPDARAQMMAAQTGMSIISKMKSSIRWTVTADKFVFFDGWSPYEDFTIIPFFAYFRRGKPFGVVENLLSPQDNLNKTASQELHSVNTTANSGWIYETGTLVDMTRDDLEREGSKTGFVLEVSRGAEHPTKIQPNPIPTGLDRVSMKAAQFVRDISGISESMLGYDGNEVSGVAIEKKQMRGLTQLQVLLDNLQKTRTMLAAQILKLVQRFYTEERIIRVTRYDRPGQPDEELAVNQMTPEGILVNDLTLGEYDLAVTSAPARDTFEDSQFGEALALRNANVMIPDDIVVEYSSLAHKRDVAERIRKMQGTADPTPEEADHQAMMAELQLQQLQLGMQELAAKIRDLNSRADLNWAKAAEAGGVQEDGSNPEGEKLALEQRHDLIMQANELAVEREKLMKQYQEKQDQFQTMLTIAKMQDKRAAETAKLNAATARQKAKETLSSKSRKGLSDVASKRKAK